MENTDNLTYGLWQMLHRTNHLMLKARQKELDAHGISIRSSAVLEMVTRLGKEATPVTMAQQIFIERHSLSEQLSRMEKEGLIVKIRDLEKKNKLRIEATEKGKQLSEKAARRESIGDILAVLTHEEQLELWSLLSKIRERTMEKLDLGHIEAYPASDPSST
ncbi:MarR family winged helix-turn-helix transcriptional regulator [Chloroflexota bacterium]